MCACGQRQQSGTTSAQLGEQAQGTEDQRAAQEQQNQRVAEAAVANSRS